MSRMVGSLSERSGTISLTLTLNAVKLESTFYPCPTPIRGLHWALGVYKLDDNLALFVRCEELATMPDLCVDVSFFFRVTGMFRAEFEDELSCTLCAKDSAGVGIPDFVSWETLIDTGCNFVDLSYRIAVEVEILPDEPTGIADLWRWKQPHHKQYNVDHVLAPDMHIVVDGYTKIPCSKSVVWRHSQVIYDAMVDAEGNDNSLYTIDLDDVTRGGARQFVTAMYNEWDEEEMDEYVGMIGKLAQHLKSGRVAQMAALAVKRLLSDSTFWATLTSAVDAGKDTPLIDQCARYAFATPDRLWSLVEREDGQQDNVKIALLGAIAKLKKEEGEKK